MRLIQATFTIIYTGRCDTYLPEADRLIIIKDDGSVAVHVDSGFKPLNYMKASKELMMVEKADGVYLKAANTKESLLIQMLDIKADIFLDFPDSERDMVKTGTEDNLQEYISNNMAALIPGYIPVCREFETGKGPVDVFGMTEERDGVALIEVKRHAHRKDVYQVVKYSNGLDEMVASARNEGIERIEAKRKGVSVVVDESFMDFRSDAEDFTVRSFAGVYDNLLVVQSLTKFFAIPGLRLGFAVAPPCLAEKLEAAKDPWNTNLLAQAAGVAALGDGEYKKQTLQWLETERDYLFRSLAAFEGIKAYPPTVNFIFLRLSPAWGSASAFCERMKEEGILLRDCSNYPGLDDTYIRVAVRKREENELLLEAFRRARGERK